jgi:hypothetical protein
MNEYTEWYPGEIKPIRKGVYQRSNNDIILYSYWNGCYWCSGGDTVELALEFKRWRAVQQCTKWRGVPF